MIVYRNYRQHITVNEQIASIEKIVDMAIPTRSDIYDMAVSLLIECGELETGITDFFCNKLDLINRQIIICRQMSMKAGDVLFSLWAKGLFLMDSLFELKSILSALKSMPLPQQIQLNVPEGFVFYGLYPEVYMEAAQVFFKEKKPENALVLGLRSIGTSLSALVGAQLQSGGCIVKSLTVRPRGHPFDRYLILDEQVKQIIQQSTDHYVLIVDEGPGLSGSSFGGALKALRNLDIAEERTLLFPSWLPSADRFISEDARKLWSDYDKYTGSFENQWILNGKLEKNLQKKIVCDISAGMWRNHFIKNSLDFPAVHPHHERRKYLLENGKNYWIAKFVGLGKYGSRYVVRANKLNETGFTPQVNQLSSGFAVMEFIEGKILQTSDVNDELIDFVKEYLSMMRKSMSSILRVGYDQMLEMIYVNIKEGLGEQWCRYMEKFGQNTSALYEEAPIAIDGHMLPQDFLKTGTGFMKVDHIEHHCDQFFHGSQNICWDIAGFCFEFELDKRKRSHFLEKFVPIDSSVFMRQPFFNVAYLAFRLGYVTLAADSLMGEPDGAEFLKLKEKYSIMLKNELLEL